MASGNVSLSDTKLEIYRWHPSKFQAEYIRRELRTIVTYKCHR